MPVKASPKITMTSMYNDMDEPVARATRSMPSEADNAPARKKKRPDAAAAPEISLERSEFEAFMAVENGNVKKLHKALLHGVDVNSRDSFKWTLLMVAASAGQLGIVKYLLEHHRAKLDIAAHDGQGSTAAYLAHRMGHKTIAALLTDPTPLQAVDPSRKPRTARAVTAASDTAPVSAWFCPECKATQTQAPSTHNASIVHHVSCQHAVSSQPFVLTAANRGYQMLVRAGWDHGGLGADGEGRLQPPPTRLKRDRGGVGGPAPAPRVTHFAAFDESAVLYGCPPTLRMGARAARARHAEERVRDSELRQMLNFS